MKNVHFDALMTGAIILIIVGVVWLEFDPDREPPKTITECVKSTVELKLVCGAGNLGGVNIGGSCQMVPRPVCVETETRTNPAWQEWMNGR